MTTKICTNCDYYKKIYDLYIINEKYVIGMISFLKYMDITEKIKELCKINWNNIIENLVKLNDIIRELSNNNNLKYSLMGDFITEYEKIKDKLKTPETFYKNGLDLLDRPNFYIELKQLLYILSDKKRCHLLVDNKKYKGLDKKYVKDIVESTMGNIDLMKQYLVRKSIVSKWGFHEYEYIREIFEMFCVINKYYKNPLKLFNININKDKSKNIDDILMEYVYKYKKDDFNENKTNTIGELLLFLKKRITLWEAVDLIFNTLFTYGDIICYNDIFGENKLFNQKNIEYQKRSVEIGFKIFVLVKHNMITNSNLFANFLI
tara:strand:+ start:2110 stop:3066 length:957 start_codon:yes stop_codon:yes gene_type:complete